MFVVFFFTCSSDEYMSTWAAYALRSTERDSSSSQNTLLQTSERGDGLMAYSSNCEGRSRDAGFEGVNLQSRGEKTPSDDQA